MLRWLLPLIAAAAVLGGSVTTWAAAGLTGDAACCCPVKAKCKCHDHDEAPSPAPELNKCGDVMKLVAPIVQIAIPAVAVHPTAEPRVADATLPAPLPLPDDRTIDVETPPF